MSLQLGSSPIDFALKGVDGNLYSLDSFKDAKYLAIMFSCNHCPYVIASEREFVKIQKDYKEHGFQLVAINSNSANEQYPGDSFDNMVIRAKERNFNFPYLEDSDQSLAKKYGAGRTPEIYLYNDKRELVYHGRINDNPKFHDKITRHDLKEALDELIKGKEISLPITNAMGCSIKFIEDN